MSERPASRTLIIAEAGVNHNGDLEMAKRLVDVAADVGADLVKFQTFKADNQVTPAARKAAYQARATGGGEAQLEMLRHLELDEQQHEALVDYCRGRGIGFFSTGFDIPSVDYLASLGQDFFKIPSGEITNLPYLRHLGAFGRRLILSTGMAGLGDIESAIEALENAGTPRALITVLHCHTDYPTSMADVNLHAMNAMAEAFGVAVGYSDHTLGIEVPVAAVALGAVVIEKHFTVDRGLPGPDHAASLEPGELADMVRAIRNIEIALGSPIKRPSAREMENRPIARKSIVAKTAIRAGEPFSEDNLTTKRPGAGISPMRWDEVIGKAAPRDFSRDELIEL